MNRWFTGVKTIEELRKEYRSLLKLYHHDNENGSVEEAGNQYRIWWRIFKLIRQGNEYRLFVLYLQKMMKIRHLKRF